MAKPWWDRHPPSRERRSRFGGGASCLSFSKPDRNVRPALILLLALAGCAGQPPFQPAPVRFGRVDFLEARETSAPPVQVRLHRDTLAPDGTAAACLELADLRNTELVVHVHLRAAPPGRYFLRVESNALADEKPFEVRP